MLNIKTETLSGVTYYSAEDSRGNVTTVFTMLGDTFVQVNRSPAKALDDIKKLSKVAAAIIEFIESEGKEEAMEEISNPRYLAFFKVFGSQPNYEYMAFISKMKKLFIGDVYGHISDHDEFTKFIEDNADKYEIS